MSSTAGRIELRPPLYGQDYAAGATAVDAGAPGWLAELNTDARRRVAAGLAAWAVAVDQEDLVDRAWQQLADAGLRPAASTDPALAPAVAAALADRHPGVVAPTGPDADRPAGIVAPAAAPAPPVADRYSPTFDEPAFGYLRAVAPDWLLPGIADVAEDSVVVLGTNPAFTEAFLVGLNHALSRELTWRRYPLDPTGTMFCRFWAAAPHAADTALPPLASWQPISRLGEHSPSADQLVLLLRGAVLRRFPTASVYLSGTAADGEVHLAPSMAAPLGTGTAFFGFPVIPDAALHPDPSTGGPAAWFVVIQEAVDHARFGIDDPPDGAAATDLAGWQDLDWAHPQLAGRTFVPVAGPLAGLSRPLAATPVGPAPRATWGGDAGSLAAIVQRPAFRIRVPVGLWLTPTDGPG